ncbi:MAG: pantetheine-phosphate adenylyltransferase [bacterium]|nr:pantetheine-phosphate adenylyltransferase [bacterium]
MRRWMYPGTFDPPTLGHLDLIKRAAPLCDELLIAVAESREKSTFFSLEERIRLMEIMTAEFTGVRIIEFDTLLTEQVQLHDVHAVLRGVRVFSDFEYEMVMAFTNRKLLNRFETIFMMPSESLMSVSSTLVREIMQFGGDVSKFVPANVLNAIVKQN